MFHVLASGRAWEAILLLGASLGAFGGWQLVRLAALLVRIDRPSHAVRPILLRGGLAVGALAPLIVAIDPVPIRPLYTNTSIPDPTLYAVAGIVGIATAIGLAIPIARHSDRFQHGWSAVRFWSRQAHKLLRRVWAELSQRWQRIRESGTADDGDDNEATASTQPRREE